MSSFRCGLHNRSPLVLLVALALLAPLLHGIEAYFASGAWSNIPLHYWVRHPHDDPGVVSWEVGRLKQKPPRVPAVYLVGGSSAREGIISARSLAADVRELGGPGIVAANLSSSLQTYSQDLAIADNVPATDAWIVVGVNAGRFARDAETSLEQAVGKGMLLESDYLHDYVAAKYRAYRFEPTILPGIFTYLSDLAHAHARALEAGKRAAGRYERHRVDAKRPLSVKTKQRYVRAWYRLRQPAFEKNYRLNMGMLDRLVARSQQRGLHVVLVELPSNGAVIGHQMDKPVSYYRPRVQRLARAYEVPYLDFNADLAIPNEYFYDLQHLTTPGRKVWQRRLARELVDLMRKADAGPGQP